LKQNTLLKDNFIIRKGLLLNKKLRLPIFIVMFIFLFSLINTHNVIAKFINDNNANLILDTKNYKDNLPSNFRKTTDLNAVQDNKNLNLKGLNYLNISGSQQFSGYNLPSLIKAIGTDMPITVVDLRQESHGFINNIPVSWANSKNNANAGLTKDQIILDEAKKIRSIKLNAPISFYNYPDVKITPIKVQNENELVTSNGLSYTRITVRDGGIPEDNMVDYFIDFIKKQPKSSWLHFHCKEGVGRTTTFMIMYDMIKNYNSVSADEIISRQVALAGLSEKEIKNFYNEERIDFLKKFYEYSKSQGDSFSIKWSQWSH
jgi:protein-tyrosine phosphatase